MPPCYEFASCGRCSRESCTFDHRKLTAEERKEKAEEFRPKSVDADGKKILCRFFVKWGRCLLQPDCPFHHERSEQPRGKAKAKGKAQPKPKPAP